MRTPKSILLIEDDQVDSLTVKRGLQTSEVGNRLTIVKNGEEALVFLRDPENPRPGIILLDLNMPRMNGIEFLKIVKKDASLKRIPVVVLTTSNADQDKVDSFNIGVAGYMIKPVDYREFVEIIATINRYWTLSELPD